MNNKDILGTLRKEFVENYKKIHNKRDRVIFFDKLHDISEKAKLYSFSLFFRGMINFLNKAYSESCKNFKEAIDKNKNFSYAYYGLGIFYEKKKENELAEEYFKKAIELDDTYPYPYNGLGIVFYNKDEFEKAISYYEKALEIDDKYPYPWQGKGAIYFDKKDFEKAIQCFTEAIDIDETFHYSWDGFGLIYLELKEYKKALKYFKKSIELDDTYANAYNSLGVVYSYQEDYEKAYQFFEKATEFDDTNALYVRNIGTSQEHLENYEIAIKFYEKALAMYQKEKNVYWISMLEDEIKNIKEIIKSTEIITESKEQDKLRPTEKILVETSKTGIEKKALDNKKSFFKFLEESTYKHNNQNYLQVLRRWNSYTPIIADNYHISKGGGYFLKIKSHGIVIDPGFNFIDNFKGTGHSFYEIDIVIVSHAHNDHTSDLESILTLLYKYNEKIKGISDTSVTSADNTIRSEIAERENCESDKVTIDQINREFAISPRRKKLDFYITPSVFKKYSGLLSLFSQNDYKLHIIEKDLEMKIEDDVSVKVIGAKHHDIISDRDSVGFIIECSNCIIIYTGDSGWNEDIANQYENVSNNYEDKYVLLIAHLGGFKEYEKLYLTCEDKEKCYSKNHFGRLGLSLLNEIIKPKICFISEFGEELKGYRIPLSKIFQSAFDNEIIFIPADVGLTFDIDFKKIKAIAKCNNDTNVVEFDFIHPTDVRTCLRLRDYSLHYYKNSSKINKEDLVQVLSHQFDGRKK